MTKHTKPVRTYESESRNEWLDRLASFNHHFGRFVRDALGVSLIAFAVMTFLALGKYTQGAWLVPWVVFLSLWFGWGSYFVVAILGYAGFSLLRRVETRLHWGRLFALEIASFLTLGLFAALGGNSVLDAEAGKYGGRIGWGITQLFWRLDKIPGTLLMFVLWLLAVMSGFNLWAFIEKWLMKVAGETPPGGNSDPARGPARGDCC
ncbi:MAG: hypothetical protein IPP66_13345 [Anaerolineales bacterium]|nr:hypothetical protein [Anaerolineales bacterium]